MSNILQLATDLDRFAFDYDPYGYWDAVNDSEQAVTSLLAQLCSPELRVGIVDYLQEIADEHDEYEVPAIKLISQIKERFLEALNDVVGDREEFLEHFRRMYYSLLDSTKLEEELEACLLECDAVAEMNRQWIEENSRNPMDPEKFIRRHNALVEKYEEHEAKANSVRSEIQTRLNKAEELSGFLFELRERDFFIEEFSDKLFLSCIERIVVNRDGTLSYEFKDGSIIKKNIK